MAIIDNYRMWAVWTKRKVVLELFLVILLYADEGRKSSKIKQI